MPKSCKLTFCPSETLTEMASNIHAVARDLWFEISVVLPDPWRTP